MGVGAGIADHDGSPARCMAMQRDVMGPAAIQLTGKSATRSRPRCNLPADPSAARFIPLFFIALKVPSAAFFAMRAYNLQGRPLWFPVVVIPILYVISCPCPACPAPLNARLSCAVGGIIGTVYLTAFPAKNIGLDCVLMDAVTAVVADLVIAGTLLHGLLRSKTGWERTDRVIKRLMRILVETQAPPTLV